MIDKDGYNLYSMTEAFHLLSLTCIHALLLIRVYSIMHYCIDITVHCTLLRIKLWNL